VGHALPERNIRDPHLVCPHRGEPGAARPDQEREGERDLNEDGSKDGLRCHGCINRQNAERLTDNPGFAHAAANACPSVVRPAWHRR
jgi:hypothetical protein